MGEDSRFYQGVFLLSLTFMAGFTCGYQVPVLYANEVLSSLK